MLSNTQWQKVKILFDRAISGGSSSEILDHITLEGGSRVRREVVRLLQLHRDRGSFFSTAITPNSAIEPQPTFAEGETIVENRFRIRRLIARGGMGEIYEAEDLQLEGLVALKAIRSDLLSAGLKERFRREVKAARAVTHPNVCRVYDLCFHRTSADSPEVLVMSMELLGGESLAGYLKRERRMPEAIASKIIPQIAAALDAAHGAGISHGDLKPANVMLVPGAGGTCRAVVTDFGLAQGLCDASNEHHSPAGTPDYMSPEQVAGEPLRPTSDLYSLGLLIHRSITGEHASFDSQNRLQRLPSSVLSGLNSRWDSVVSRCLQPQPQNRFQNGAQVVQALAALPRWKMAVPFAALALLAVVGLLELWRPPASRVPHVVSVRRITDDTIEKSMLLAVDGSLYFRDRGPNIYRVPESGGPAVPIVDDAYLFGTVPHALLLLRGNNVWKWPVNGGPLQKVNVPFGSPTAYFEPLDWVVNAGGHFSVVQNGKETLQVRQPVDSALEFSWAADGRLMESINNFATGKNSIWIGKPPGILRRIKGIPETVMSGFAWTSDRHYMIFSATRDIEGLWSLRTRDGVVSELTSGPVSYNSPATGLQPNTVFAIGRSDRLQPVVIENGHAYPFGSGRSQAFFDFSRDGKTVVYSSLPEDSLWVRDPNGKERKLHDGKSLQAIGNHLSPDGKTIAFMGEQGQSDRVYTMPISGGTPRRLTNGSSDEGIPTWSADGRYLAFGELKYRKKRESMAIHIFDTRSQTMTWLQGSTGMWSPRWSPDGRFISAISSDEKTLNLYDTRSSTWTRLASAPYLEHPAWSPDSKYIYAHGDLDHLYKIHVPDGQLTIAADYVKVKDFLGTTPKGLPLAMQVTSLSDIYELKLELP